MANFYAFYPPSSAAGSNASVGANGATAPTSSTEVGGINPSGNLQPLSTDASGNLNVVLVGSTPVVSENIAQFGGNNVVTGTGPSGLGIPRVTVSNDSSVIVSSSALPTGAATSANQTTANTSLSTIATNTTGVSTAANQTTANTTLGNIQANQTNGTQLTGITGTLPLPTGASTSALQTTGNTSLSTIATNTTGLALDSHLTNVQSAPGTPQTVALTVQGNASAVPVPISGTVTASITGVATSANQTNGTQTTQINGGGNTATVTASNALKVDGSAVTQPVSGSVSVSNFPATQPVSGTVTANAGTGTFAVSASSLPLPTGAATSANLTTLGSQTTKLNDGTNTATIKPASTAAVATDTAIVVAISPNNSITASNPSVGVTGTTAPTSATEIGIIVGGNLQGVSASNPLPISGSITASNPSVGTTGVTAPTSATEMGGINAGNLVGISVDASGNQNVNVLSSALPTGASTSALQTTGNSSLATIATNTTNLTVAQGSTTSGQNGQLIQGAVTTAAPTYTTAQTSPLSLKTTGDLRVDSVIADGYLATIATNTGATATDTIVNSTITALNGTVVINNQALYTTTVSITGTWSATLVFEGQLADNTWVAVPAYTVQGTLPYPAVFNTTTNGTFIVTGGGYQNLRVRASAFTSGTVAVGLEASSAQQTISAAQLGNWAVSGTGVAGTPATGVMSVQGISGGTTLGVTDAALADIYLTGQAAQTATVNNILTATSGAAATDASGYHSASVQVVSTGTGGTYIFEGSNDNVNFQAIPVFSQLVLTGTPITAAITATASQLIYTFPVQMRYIRLRIATAITGGSIQAFSKISQTPYATAITQVAQATAANLATTATIASGTVTTVSSVTSAQAAIPGTITDVASVAITTTATTAAITPTFGSSYLVNIAVTAVTGTTPTYAVTIQESADAGTNWYNVYTFPTITAAGSYNSPTITLTGNRVRYVQTLGGTTPSFTRAIVRLQSSQAGINAPGATVFADRSGTTSATPSTSTQVAGANQTRRYFVIQNVSLTTPIWINFTSAANAGSGSIYLAPLASYGMEGSTITTEAINVLATAASIPFTAKEG